MTLITHLSEIAGSFCVSARILFHIEFIFTLLLIIRYICNLALARRGFSNCCARWEDSRLGRLVLGKECLDFFEGSALRLKVMLAKSRRAGASRED